MTKWTKLILCVGIGILLSVGFHFLLSEPDALAKIVLALGVVGWFLSIITTPQGFHGNFERNIWAVGVVVNAAVYWAFITLAEKLLKLRAAKRDQLTTGN